MLRVTDTPGNPLSVGLISEMHSALCRAAFQLTAGITLFTLWGVIGLRAQSASPPDSQELKASAEASEPTRLEFGSNLQKGATAAAPFSADNGTKQFAGDEPEQAGPADKSAEVVKTTSAAIIQNSKVVDLNQSIYHKNVLEFSLEGGWLPINIPFVFDVFLGDGYTMTPLKYTLIPVIGSLRWQMDDVGGPWFFRGNWDMTFSGSVTAIPRGPESRYFSYIMGVRRNFVPRHSRVTAYFDYRLGMGNIDAKGPKGVPWAQGQDFTFTMNMGSGARYHFSPRYSIAAGLNWMHVSNLYLSEPRYKNYGINVYGPLVGIYMRLGKAGRKAGQ